MNSVTPVVEGLEPFELKIGGPDNNQPQFFTLYALRATDGRVMSRWNFTAEERAAIASGADVYISIKCDGLYPPTSVWVSGHPDWPAEQCKAEMKLDEELSLRLLAQERDRIGLLYKEASAAFQEKVVAVYGEPQHYAGLGGEKKNG